MGDLQSGCQESLYVPLNDSLFFYWTLNIANAHFMYFFGTHEMILEQWAEVLECTHWSIMQFHKHCWANFLIVVANIYSSLDLSDNHVTNIVQGVLYLWNDKYGPKDP